MAIKVRIPNNASQTTVSASVPCSIGNDVWLGLVTPPTSSGSVTYFRTASETAGCIMCSIVTGCYSTVFLPYPFNSPAGIFAASISGGSAFFWMTT